MKKYTHLLILFLLLALGFFLRLYKLGEVPFGFYRDESAIGYNAYSIMLTGKDEYGLSFPLYFKSFGDYKLPVYVYSTIPSIKIFGMTPFAVRFPSAFFGCLTLIAVYFLLQALTKNRIVSLVTLAFFVINPWTLFYNRATFEVSICLFFFVAGTYFIYKSITQNKNGFFLLGSLSFVFSLYGYNLTRLLSPLLFAAILYVYKGKLKSVNKKEIVIACLICVVCLIPFIATFFHSGGVTSASGTLIFSSAVVKAPLIEFRSYFITFPSILVKTFFNQDILILWQYIRNLVNYFSVEFFFLNGEPGGNLTIGNYGYFYLFELPLIIWGLIICLKEKKPWQILFILWAILTIMVASLTRDIPQATRSYFLVLPAEVFSSLGIIAFWSWLGKRQQWVRIGILSVPYVFIMYTVVFYFADYYYHFPVSFAKAWKSEDKDISRYLASQDKNYKHIIIDPSADLGYTSILFFQKYPPQKFQSSVVRTPDDSEGFTYVLSFGKYEYRVIDWTKDYKPGNLLVAGPNAAPVNILRDKIFFYPTRPIVLALKQQSFSYPVTDIAYVVISAKK